MPGCQNLPWIPQAFPRVCWTEVASVLHLQMSHLLEGGGTYALYEEPLCQFGKNSPTHILQQPEIGRRMLLRVTKRIKWKKLNRACGHLLFFMTIISSLVSACWAKDQVVVV